MFFSHLPHGQDARSLWRQLGFVPIKCLQSNANGHKLLLRQPRHSASLTDSSLSVFFFQTQTHRALTHHAHVLPINGFFSWLLQWRNKLSHYSMRGSDWKAVAELSVSDGEGVEEGDRDGLSFRPKYADLK